MRSMLFTPALDDGRALNGWRFGPDAIILDLEDTVPPERKNEARIKALGVLEASGRDYFVRINSFQTEWWRLDVEAVLHPRLAGLVVPKVESAKAMIELDDILSSYAQSGNSSNSIRLLPIIETVAGWAEIRSIARASRRILALTFGEGDFTLDLGLDWRESPTVAFAKAQLVLESRLAGLAPPHDGVFPRIGDELGLKQSAERAKDIGFGTKHCIHPSQIPVIHAAFSPTPDERRRAASIVAAFEASLKQGVASITVDGQFVDYPVYQRAVNILKEGETNG